MKPVLNTAAGLLLACVSLQAQAKPASLRLVDDRGKAIAAPLEVCFQIATRSDCVAGVSRESSRPPSPQRKARWQ